MTETNIQQLGFEFVKEYKHDQFKTRRYEKGVLEVEFTYENELIDSIELTIQAVNCQPINFDQLEVLSTILGKWKS